MSFGWIVYASILNIIFFLPKKNGEHVPLATGAYASDKIWYLNLNIFHSYTMFAFIISLAKIIKRTLSNHDVLAWNNEHNTLVFALFLLIISISIHLFIHLTTQERKKKKLCNISRYIVKNIKKRRFFLNSKRREYLATGTQGQNSPTFFPTLRKKLYHIVSPSAIIFSLSIH